MKASVKKFTSCIKSHWTGKRKLHLVGGSLILILLLFSFTSYLSKVGQDGYYHTNGSNHSLSASSSKYIDLPAPTISEVIVDRGVVLKWEPISNEGVYGYNIYRFKSPEEPGERINSTPQAESTYYDDDGNMFCLYAVAAVDSEGREGPKSSPVKTSAEPKTIVEAKVTAPPEVKKDVTFTPSNQTKNTSPPTKTQPSKKLPAGMVDEVSPGMSYRGEWFLEHYPEAYGGSLMVAADGGNYVSYTFQGSQVTVISCKHMNYGIMDIYLDDQLVGSADLYSASVVWNAKVFTMGGLTPGVHTLKIVCTGKKNPQARYPFVAIDAIEVR